MSISEIDIEIGYINLDIDNIKRFIAETDDEEVIALYQIRLQYWEDRLKELEATK